MNAKERNALPSSKFALPSVRKYPVDTHNRAANAKARASEMEHKGVISPSTKATIDRRANAMLGHSSVRNAKSHQGKLHHS